VNCRIKSSARQDDATTAVARFERGETGGSMKRSTKVLTRLLSCFRARVAGNGGWHTSLSLCWAAAGAKWPYSKRTSACISARARSVFVAMAGRSRAREQALAARGACSDLARDSCLSCLVQGKEWGLMGREMERDNNAWSVRDHNVGHRVSCISVSPWPWNSQQLGGSNSWSYCSRPLTRTVAYLVCGEEVHRRKFP
jgi:hypothetical protein